jgi:hypothetical protein
MTRIRSHAFRPVAFSSEVLALLEADDRLERSPQPLQGLAVRQSLVGAFVDSSVARRLGATVRFEGVLALSLTLPIQELCGSLEECAAILCPLEAMAHLTEEARGELVGARERFEVLAAACAPTLPFPFSTARGLRFLLGVGFAQASWMVDVRFAKADPHERAAMFLESPAHSWAALAPLLSTPPS